MGKSPFEIKHQYYAGWTCFFDWISVSKRFINIKSYSSSNIMKSKIPKIKKKISTYLLSEEGKISKQALFTMGSFLGGAALGIALSAEEVEAPIYHTNGLSLSYSGGTATATHSHHASHSSY